MTVNAPIAQRGRAGWRLALCLVCLSASPSALRADEAPPPPADSATAYDSWTTETIAAIADLADLPVADGCATGACHEELRSRPYKHGPVFQDVCQPCHVPIDGKHRFEPRPSTEYLCRVCHHPYPPEKQKHLDTDRNCEKCHDPHGGKERYFLKAGSVKETCLGCHPEKRHGQPAHNPVEQGTCLSCHEMHHAEAEPLLRGGRTSLCLKCHKAVAKHLDEAVSVHPPVKQDCTLCHQPHGGGYGKARLKEPLPGLCQRCHSDKIKWAKSVKHPHEAVTSGEFCLNCHDPHSSQGRHILKEPTRDLCLKCHDRPYTLADGSVLANVKEQLLNSSHLHGPARQGSCTPCHNPHGGNYFRMLNFDFPPGFYASFKDSIYALCFQCHDHRMVTDPESTVTGFRNGKRNLHYLHVNQQNKGRTCRACHHEHASNNPLQIREFTPFGKWSMPIVFSLNGNGGGCANACHGEYTYDREHPVQNAKKILPPPKADDVPTVSQTAPR